MFWLRCLSCVVILSGGFVSPASALNYEEYPSIRLRTLDKVTARTLTMDAQVGSTIKFGDIYIKIQSCRKPPAIEKTEAAAFLQIWQVDRISQESNWIFSGWMFASSPALSGMNHPVYDVWVMDCFGKDADEMPPAPVEDSKKDALPDEGTVPENTVVTPEVAPEEQQPVEHAPIEEEPYIDNPQVNPAPAPVPIPRSTQQQGDEQIEGIY